MPPYVALALWFGLLVALFRFDSRNVPATSYALWVPLAEFVIAGSRLPSQWLGLVHVGTGAQAAVEEGNAFDRSVYLTLILLSFAILAYRRFKWGTFVRQNLALVAFLGLALTSVVWSDYPFVTFKRWFRDLVDYVAVLVLLSDARPLDAIRVLFRRACFLLVPLSIVLIKYFPNVGRQYDVWSGSPMAVGVTTSKNMLGLLCLLSATVFVWDTLTRWPDRRQRRTRRVLLVNVAFILMTEWLLVRANSATATLCLALGCVLLVVAEMRPIKRQPGLLLGAVPVALCLYAVLAFGFGLDLTSTVASVMGRDPTLTGRTLIWETLVGLHTNPIVGTGYESFWLGPRLQRIWAVRGTINEAHNGYLEIYLNLGLVGVGLLGAFLIASYRQIWQRRICGHPLASFGFAVWTVLLFYSFTESALPKGLLWLTLLVGVLTVPEPLALVQETTAAIEEEEWIPRRAWAEGRRAAPQVMYGRSPYAPRRYS